MAMEVVPIEGQREVICQGEIFFGHLITNVSPERSAKLSSADRRGKFSLADVGAPSAGSFEGGGMNRSLADASSSVGGEGLRRFAGLLMSDAFPLSENERCLPSF